MKEMKEIKRGADENLLVVLQRASLHSRK